MSYFTPNSGPGTPHPTGYRHDPAYIITAECPLCQGALRLRQTRDSTRFYIACTRRPCDFTASYDPVLQALRNQIARLQAELTLERMQRRVLPEDVPLTSEARMRALTTWQDVAERWEGRA